MNNLSAAKGGSKGEINLQWDSAENAESYIIEIGNSNYSNVINWKILDIISDSKYTVRNLRSKKDYFFKVAYVYPDGSKEKSRRVVKEAP